MRLLKLPISLCLLGALLPSCNSDLGVWTVNDVNDSGVLVGTQTAGTQTVAVRFANGQLQALPNPVGGDAAAVGIANDGTIVGETANGLALWQPDGSFVSVGKLNG